MAAPALTSSTRLRALRDDRRAPLAALAVACIAAFALIMYLGRGVGFYFDEWNFVLERLGHSPDVFLRPHNEHISVLPIAVYKVLLQTAGLGSHWPYQAVLGLMHVALAGGVFVLVRRRLGGWAALGVAVLVLFMGVAWQNILWAFQIGFVGSVLGGVWAMVALDRRDTRGDVLACVALLAATLCSSLGVPLALGAAVELLVARRARALWVAAVPLVIYGVWYLGYGKGDITGQGILHAGGWATAAAAGAAGALFDQGSNWGVPLVVVLLAGLVWRTALAPWTPRLAGVVTSGVVFWLLTGAARSVTDPPVPPDSSRYLTLGAIVIALIAVELIAAVPINPRVGAIGVAVVALTMLVGAAALRDNANVLRSLTGTFDAELGAMQLARPSAPPGYVPDSNIAPQVHAGKYFAATKALGSSAGDDPAALEGDLSGDRAAADRVLQELTARLSPVAGRPAGCATQAKPVVTATVPPAGLVIRAAGKEGVEVKLRRFGDAFSQPALGTVAPGAPQLLKLPRDASPKPYVVQLASPTGAATCPAS